MRLAVLTPVGPNHEWAAWRAYSSSCSAWNYRRGPFTEFRHFFFDDRAAKYGRSAGRNRLLERARKGWGADWIINLDANDMIHPGAFDAIGRALDENPRLGHIVGCHSMLLSRSSAEQSLPEGSAASIRGHEDVVHVYRTRFDVWPLTWERMVELNHWGTSGTITATRADLAYKLGFLPELPAGDVWEFTWSVMAHCEFTKLRRPIVITDRVTPGAGVDPTDPWLHTRSRQELDRGEAGNHVGILEEALEAVREVWAQRGRRPFSYIELEHRWRSRFKLPGDFHEDTLVVDAAPWRVPVDRETGKVIR